MVYGLEEVADANGLDSKALLAWADNHGKEHGVFFVPSRTGGDLAVYDYNVGRLIEAALNAGVKQSDANKAGDFTLE